jgi:hypothetical protein
MGRDGLMVQGLGFGGGLRRLAGHASPYIIEM